MATMDRLLIGTYHLARSVGGALSDATDVGGIAITKGATAAVSEGLYRVSYKLGDVAWVTAGNIAGYLATFPDYIMSQAVSDWQPNYLYEKTIDVASKASEGLGIVNEYATNQLLNGAPKPYPDFSAAHLIAPTFVFVAATQSYSNSVNELLNSLIGKTTVTCYDDACHTRSERKFNPSWTDTAKIAAKTIFYGFVSYTAAQGIIRQLPENIHPTVDYVCKGTLLAISIFNTLKSSNNSTTNHYPSKATSQIVKEEACCDECQKGDTCASFKATDYSQHADYRQQAATAA